MKTALTARNTQGDPPWLTGAMIMAGPHVASPADTARLKQLEGALNTIGVTGAHRSIIGLILVGCLFDAFEQNSIGIIGYRLSQHHHLRPGRDRTIADRLPGRSVRAQDDVDD
jgi:hypothetical protein